MALAGLAASRASAATAVNPLKARAPHFAPKAKRVIFLFMQGGVSHVDSFDHKPRLAKDDGKMQEFDDARTLAKTRKIVTHRVFQSPWKFKSYGQSGLMASDLFPLTATHADDL